MDQAWGLSLHQWCGEARIPIEPGLGMECAMLHAIGGIVPPEKFSGMLGALKRDHSSGQRARNVRLDLGLARPAQGSRAAGSRIARSRNSRTGGGAGETRLGLTLIGISDTALEKSVAGIFLSGSRFNLFSFQ